MVELKCLSLNNENEIGEIQMSLNDDNDIGESTFTAKMIGFVYICLE